MSIRTKFVAVLTSILALGIGTTGAVLILRHARHDRAEIDQKQLLLVEHAAFAMRENLSVAARELVRLSRLPQFDLADNDLRPERELLHSAHENSVFFKEVCILDRDGRVTLVQPEPGARQGPADVRPAEVDAAAPVIGESYASAPWFDDARRARQPFFYLVPEGTRVPTSIAVVVPVRYGGRFDGAIQGLLDLAGDTVLTPELRHTAGAGEFAVVARDGRVIFPAGSSDLGARGFQVAFQELAQGHSGSRHAAGESGEYLYSYAPVGIGGWGVTMRWPWRMLDADTGVQIQTTVAILILGVVLATLASVLFAAYLTRPLEVLGEVAARLGRGERGGAGPSRRGDEIGALFNAFHHMEQELAASAQKIREDLETISRLNATLEGRVRERTRELELAQARLLEVERFAAMGKTAAAIAHELRNALNGLGMCVELVMTDTPPSAGSARVRAQIHYEVARLRDITDSLLTFSRTPRLDLGEVDLNAVVRRALAVLEEQIADAGVVVVARLAQGGGPLPLVCDGNKIQGVLINLVKNAVESMATRPLDLAGDGAAALGRERRVEIATRREPEGGGLVVEVSDTGSGIVAEAHDHLFEPFFTTKVTGTGLGLATARRVVDAHGGTVTAGDAPGGGACFVVRLPEKAAAAPPLVSLAR